MINAGAVLTRHKILIMLLNSVHKQMRYDEPFSLTFIPDTPLHPLLVGWMKKSNREAKRIVQVAAQSFLQLRLGGPGNGGMRRSSTILTNHYSSRSPGLKLN